MKENIHLNVIKGIGVIIVIALAFIPLTVMVEIWVELKYGVRGAFLFSIVAALFIWSASTPLKSNSLLKNRIALSILTVSLFAQLLALFIKQPYLGAFALIPEFFALALLTNLSAREKAISPFWLTALFSFCLPAELILRMILLDKILGLGIPSSCGILRATVPGVFCDRNHIYFGSSDTILNVPFYGLNEFIFSLLVLIALSAVVRPGILGSISGGIVTLVFSQSAYLFRILMVAAGTASPDNLMKIDINKSPWTGIIDLLVIIIEVTPLLIWALLVCARKIKAGPINRFLDSSILNIRHFFNNRFSSKRSESC